MKYIEENSTVTAICYSCITGKAVWLYQGPSKQAARAAYRRACEREIQRVRAWSKRSAERKANIKRLLGECMGDIPITASMTDEQDAAAKLLLSMSGRTVPFCRDFYEHIMEERRRHDEDKRIRKQMRKRQEKETTLKNN